MDANSPELETERCLLRLPRSGDAAGIADFFSRNRKHLEPWDPSPPPGFFTESFWKPRVAEMQLEFQRKQSLRLHIFLKDTGALIGMANFANLRRGVSQCSGLGYRMDGELQGRGLMTEALAGAIAYVFDELNFHRIEANYIPTNAKSARVLEKLGFEREGLARQYLLIDGEWRNHVLTSLTNGRWRPDSAE